MDFQPMEVNEDDSDIEAPPNEPKASTTTPEPRSLHPLPPKPDAITDPRIRHRKESSGKERPAGLPPRPDFDGSH